MTVVGSAHPIVGKASVREGNECEQAKDIGGGGRSRLAYIPKIGRYTQPDLVFSSNTFKYLQIVASL